MQEKERNKGMKKILALLLIMAMGISLLVGCGGTDKDTDKGNDTNVNQDAEDGEASKGIQTIELRASENDYIEISYDADVLECNGDENGAFFYEIEGDASFSLGLGSDAYSMIESNKGYEWMEDYTATTITEKFINGVLVQSFKESYNYEGELREEELYCVPLKGGVSLVFEGKFSDSSLIEKALVSVKSNTFVPFTENDIVVLKDPSGKEMYKLYLDAYPGAEIKLISNENGKATFEFTAETEEGELLTRPVEINVNAYSSGDAYFSAVSGKYYHTYDPFEWDNKYGGKYVTMTGFWDERTADGIIQYEDHVFYIELPDGNLITGVCDYAHERNIGVFFNMGIMPVQ